MHRDLRVGKPIPSFDMSAACSGFLFGLEVVTELIGAGRYGSAWCRGEVCCLDL